jgi:hypothetical protein
MDIKTLVVGQDVFMRSGQVGNWGKVLEATSEGVIVASDPRYGTQTIRFDNNGVACYSGDLCVSLEAWGDTKIPGTSEDHPWQLYLNIKEAGFAKTIDQSSPKTKELLNKQKQKL